MVTEITVAAFEASLPMICQRDTSANPKRWTENNIFLGQCISVAMLAQWLFEGKIFRAKVYDLETNTGFGDHYYNEFPNGITKDFTVFQFPDPDLIAYTNRRPIDPHLLLSNGEAERRYNILRKRFDYYLQTHS